MFDRYVKFSQKVNHKTQKEGVSTTGFIMFAMSFTFTFTSYKSITLQSWYIVTVFLLQTPEQTREPSLSAAPSLPEEVTVFLGLDVTDH